MSSNKLRFIEFEFSDGPVLINIDNVVEFRQPQNGHGIDIRVVDGDRTLHALRPTYSDVVLMISMDSMRVWKLKDLEHEI